MVTGNSATPVGVLGAGSIGAYVGARLAEAGVPVTLVGRQSLVRTATRDGIVLSSWARPVRGLPPDAIRVTSEAAALRETPIVLVTVKGRDTREAAETLREYLPVGATVVSLQNGVENAGRIRAVLPNAHVLAGMVSFNVVWSEGNRFHQGTSGPLVVENGAGASEVVDLLLRAGFEASAHDDIDGILWGKLLLNLNNAINALSGRPLREELADRRYRRIVADSIDEAMRVLRRAGIRPRGSGTMLPTLAPRILRLPDFLFFRVASAMLRIDPQAISSMQDDLRRGKPTEVDDLNGAVVRLGSEVGEPTPRNAAIVALVRAAEAAAPGSVQWDAEELERILADPSVASTGERPCPS